MTRKRPAPPGNGVRRPFAQRQNILRVDNGGHMRPQDGQLRKFTNCRSASSKSFSSAMVA